MPSRLDLEIPYPGHSFSFGELEQFVKVALSHGATADTAVAAVPVHNTDDVIDCLRIEFDAPGAAQVEREDLAELLNLLSEIESNDGDARAQLRAVQDIRRRLTGEAR
ncbi:hypothetical protein ACIBQ0_22530 [Nocardia nova]|uniref:hypothetical protein n=1 Tax=Nocardia nova TaxID=37330 RepID=UPI0037A9655B